MSRENDISARGRPGHADENEIVERIIKRYAASHPLLEKGIGDDAAVWLPGGAREFWVATTDMLLEDVDFRREWAPPRKLGCKSIAVNLSDLGAMGSKPRFFTVSLGLPDDITNRWIQDFYAGLTSFGGEYGAILVGGDLSGADKITISITAFGESENRKIVYRSGGLPGDLLYVTGTLGKSAAGLKLLQQGSRLQPRCSAAAKREALIAHFTPEPRCSVGQWLAQSNCVHCMMDVSDGLSSDLPRMCAASGTDAEIFTEKIPVFTKSSSWGFDALELALSGGEDYELLFAVPREKEYILEKLPPEFPPVTRIGRMIKGNGKAWIIGANGMREPLSVGGFDHFRGSRYCAGACLRCANKSSSKKLKNQGLQPRQKRNL